MHFTIELMALASKSYRPGASYLSLAHWERVSSPPIISVEEDAAEVVKRGLLLQSDQKCGRLVCRSQGLNCDAASHFFLYVTR